MQILATKRLETQASPGTPEQTIFLALGWRVSRPLRPHSLVSSQLNDLIHFAKVTHLSEYLGISGLQLSTEVKLMKLLAILRNTSQYSV